MPLKITLALVMLISIHRPVSAYELFGISLPSIPEGIYPPISIVSRDSIFGKGIVIAVTNTSQKYLHECGISVNSSNYKVFKDTLSPHAGTEIGWLELGYELRRSDSVAIKCKDYLLSYSAKLSEVSERL